MPFKLTNTGCNDATKVNAALNLLESQSTILIGSTDTYAVRLVVDPSLKKVKMQLSTDGKKTWSDLSIDWDLS